MKKHLPLTLLLTPWLFTPMLMADDTCPSPAVAGEQQSDNDYCETFTDALRIVEATINMQDELTSNPSNETVFKLLSECARRTKSKTGKQLLIFNNPQLVKFLQTKEDADIPGQQSGIIGGLESLASNGYPHVWAMLAGLAAMDTRIPEAERNQRMMDYLSRSAQEGSACGMVSLAGSYLKNNTPELPANTIPDWCAKSIIAHNLHLSERLSNGIPGMALRIIALNYLLRGQGSPELAATAAYLLTCIMDDYTNQPDDYYILGEAIRHLPEDAMEDRYAECLMAYYKSAQEGHPAAIEALAELLRTHPDYSEEDIAQLRQQAVTAGYNPLVNYLSNIKTRQVAINFHFNEIYLFLLNRQEIEKISAQAKSLLPHCPERHPIHIFGNLKQFVTLLADDERMNLYIRAAESTGSTAAPVEPAAQEMEISVKDGEIDLLSAVRDSASDTGTALALDAALSLYADAHPEHLAIVRVLRLANLHRTLRAHDEYGLTAALRMLHIERELGGCPGITESQRNDLLRVFGGILRHTRPENTTQTEE